MATQDPRHPTTGTYPLGQLEEFAVADGFPDPRGWSVYGADRHPVGTVEDVLVDLETLAVRYLDVWIGVPGGARGGRVLVPVGLATTDGAQRVVVLDVSAARAVALPAYGPQGARGRPGPLARAEEQALLRGLAAVGGVGGADAPSDDRYYDRPEFATERFYRGFAGAQSGLTGAAGAAANVLRNAGSVPPAALDAVTAHPPAVTAPTGAAPAPAPAPRAANPDEVRVVAMGEEAVVTTRRVVREVLVIRRRRVVEQQEVEVDLRSERVEVVPPAPAA